MKKSTTADRLKYLKRYKGLKQSEMIEACNRVCRQLGIKEFGKSTISQYINGKVEPKQDKIYIMAKAFGVNEAWLMGWEDTEDDVSENTGQQTTEDQLIEKFRSLSAAMQEKVIKIIDILKG